VTKPNYEKEISMLVAQTVGISASRIRVETDEPNGKVTVSWQTSSLMRGEKREDLLKRAQAILPEHLRISIA
jgi:hypothetical protein